MQVIVDAAHNPAGMAASMDALAEAFPFTDLIGILAVSEDKDVPAILDQLEPAVSELVVTCNSSTRSMAPAKLAELAGAIFGPDRVRQADRLDDAIEIAVGLADDAAAAGALPGGSGILITGSVITAGDARLLLAPSGETAGRETAGRETAGRETAGREAIGSATAGPETARRETARREATGRESGADPA